MVHRESQMVYLVEFGSLLKWELQPHFPGLWSILMPDLEKGFSWFI